MIIDWQGIYQNGEYYSAGLYGINGIIGFGAIPISVEGVWRPLLRPRRR
jgi:hypothetical protein